jgi:Mn2+/Fe2+ NRAMP family transporter
MGFSNVIALMIIVSTAATLNRAGITDIATSAQAAEALRPLAGDFAFLLFSLGIIGTGKLAVPVLAGSAAYAVARRSNGRAASTLSFSKRASSTRSSRSRRSRASRSTSRRSIRSRHCSGALSSTG